ncbi:hypothetical protein RRG08_060363 [Elysia crispata]|uniref:Uncharacterized protein n=1 Tax=Elysia crispata TaxID=231223 RepID=A0AAE0ZID1_9GAST|nr:hypothetical protein RRG08_060363 [Elysia crispata]
MHRRCNFIFVSLCQTPAHHQLRVALVARSNTTELDSGPGVSTSDTLSFRLGQCPVTQGRRRSNVTVLFCCNANHKPMSQPGQLGHKRLIDFGHSAKGLSDHR